MKAKITLLINQKYSLNNKCELTAVKDFSLRQINFEDRRPTNICPIFTGRGNLSIFFAFFNEDEVSVLMTICPIFKLELKLWEKNQSEDNAKIIIIKYTIVEQHICFPELLYPSISYYMKVRIVHQDLLSEWSDIAEFTSPGFEKCVWKEFSGDTDGRMNYSIDENDPRIATKNDNGNDYRCCTVIGNTLIPFNKVASWNIRILNSRNDTDYCLLIGVAPFDIDQTGYNNESRCGWYFRFSDYSLHSGPPHYYRNKGYGPIWLFRKPICNGDTVGVVMDTIRSEISFVVNDVNHGVAYKGIPLDKPLVPCALIYKKDDSVEIKAFEVKDIKVDPSIPAPTNVTAESKLWNAITITWEGTWRVSCYQIEVDGSQCWGTSTTNTFTKEGFLQETEHTFRVRTIKGDFASEWSLAVKGRTQKESFKTCTWKECPEFLGKYNKYSIDVSNTKIATKIKDGYYCTAIGNTPLPLNKVTSWNIKVLRSERNDGYLIYIGVAPFDIDQGENYNFEKYGWYFSCYKSTLCSGPPHSYRDKEYRPLQNKVWEGSYVHSGDIIGVIMDTAKGDLSFVLNGVNYGVAFEGIPLDKPIVPCVLLSFRGDSVELDTSSEVKENLSNLISAPSITAKSTTWNSFILIWNLADGASFYQIEVDGSKFWSATTGNTFEMRGLIPDSEHSFRVRTVRDNSVSEWSGVVKGKK